MMQPLFREDFKDVISQVADLDENTPSETILAIKESLDRLYQVSCSLAGDLSEHQGAISRLIASIMAAIRKESLEDSHAMQQLADEDIARSEHFKLQQIPLIADITAEDSPIGKDELIPTLLSVAPNVLLEALSLFDENQLLVILHEATNWLEKIDSEHKLDAAARNLELIGAHMQELDQTHSVNHDNG